MLSTIAPNCPSTYQRPSCTREPSIEKKAQSAIGARRREPLAWRLTIIIVATADGLGCPDATAQQGAPRFCTAAVLCFSWPVYGFHTNSFRRRAFPFVARRELTLRHDTAQLSTTFRCNRLHLLREMPLRLR